MKERTTIYLPPALRKEIETSAEEKGQTLSMWIERACRAVLSEPKQDDAREAEV